MQKVQDHSPTLNAKQEAWLEDNRTRQVARHQQIEADMDALSAQREEWIEGFLERIQRLGFNYNCDLKRKIASDELPAQSDRPFKVVF
jgi:hypothetical protein